MPNRAKDVKLAYNQFGSVPSKIIIHKETSEKWVLGVGEKESQEPENKLNACNGRKVEL